MFGAFCPPGGIPLDDPYGLLGGLGSPAPGPAAPGCAPRPPGACDPAGFGAAGLRFAGEEPGFSLRGLQGLWAPPLPEARLGPGFGAPPGEAAPGELWHSPEEVCAECGGQMRRGTSDLEYVCAGCGLILEGDTAEPDEDDAPRPAPSAGRLRIVGPNSNQLQPDLYRSGTGTTAATQKKQISEEYKSYRAFYIEAGGRAFPLNACDLAAEYYGDVQRRCVKRSQNKKAIMAACLWRACLEIEFAPSKAEVAAFMQLSTRGIARGDNFVRSLIADGSMDIEANADPCRPEIGTLFAHLAYDGDRYAGLREAVYELVQTAIRNNIGTSSILRSKVAGATFAVLRRCRDRELVPKPPSLQEFCQNRIRKNTVERFLRKLDDYHSYFEEGYRKAGLDAAPPRG